MAIDSVVSNIDDRIASGSFFTPADVVSRFWREYWRFHRIQSLETLKRHLQEFTFVEPSAGAGIFLFVLLEEAMKLGCTSEDLEVIRFNAIDLNHKALHFMKTNLNSVGVRLGIEFRHVEFTKGDFRKVNLPRVPKISFVGNPPYVRNRKGARWRNLYADFLERILEVDERERSLALIVPLSIAFSRNYSALRQAIRQNAAVRLDNFDNMPDFLFKVGKPGSRNTNRANSQRCSILMVSNRGTSRQESTQLQRWSSSDRANFLSRRPVYKSFVDYALDDQFPRPSCDWIVRYLSNTDGSSFSDLVAMQGRFSFSVGAVARNFIGIRERTSDSASHTLWFETEQQMLSALQLVGSEVFYEYWRTVGDGFHVTKSDILRFPMTRSLLDGCQRGIPLARAAWANRAKFAKKKMNAGKEVCSYDFTGHFYHLQDFLFDLPTFASNGPEVLKLTSPAQVPLPNSPTTRVPI